MKLFFRSILTVLILKGVFVYSKPQPVNNLNLAKEEKARLAEHSVIRVHNEMNWAPFNFNKNGQPLFYSIDFMNLLANKLDLG